MYTVILGSFPLNPLSFKHGPLNGSGNAMACIDSTGKLISNHSANAGIPYTTPDGTQHYIRVSNLNVITATTGAC